MVDSRAVPVPAQRAWPIWFIGLLVGLLVDTPRWLPAGARDFFTDPPKGGSFSHWQCHAKQVTPRVWPKYLRPPWRGSGRAADRAGRRRPRPGSLSSRSFDSTAGGPRNRRRRGRTWTTPVPDCGAGPGFFLFPSSRGVPVLSPRRSSRVLHAVYYSTDR